MKGDTNGKLNDDRRSGGDAVRDSGDDGGLCSVLGAGAGHLGVRFCTSCQASKDEAGGQFRRSRNTARWICLSCVERRTVSIYKSQGRTHDPKALERLLERMRGSA